MALHIRDPEADRLARELAARTGQPITRVVVEALRDRLQREQARTTPRVARGTVDGVDQPGREVFRLAAGGDGRGSADRTE